jgi:hypothetical protein
MGQQEITPKKAQRNTIEDKICNEVTSCKFCGESKQKIKSERIEKCSNYQTKLCNGFPTNFLF